MLPELFKLRMKSILEENYEDFLLEFDKDPVRSLSINHLKIDNDTLVSIVDFPIETIPYLDGCYIFHNDKIGHHPLHHSGAFYVQDPSAIATIAAANDYLLPNMKVLDMCAAPGGKTFQIAQRIGNTGTIIANEYNRDRSKILRSNIERLGIRNTIITNSDTSLFGELYPDYFDFVLCDVPCSGEGMFRKYNEEAFSNWSIDNINLCAERQKDIFNNAYKCTKNGGYILYSTCTFSLEENEDNIDYFLTKYKDLSIVPLSDEINKHTSDGITKEYHNNNLKNCRRFYPHISQGEGQFICLLQKNNNYENVPLRSAKNSSLIPLTKEEQKIVSQFLDTIDFEISNLYKFKDTIFSVPLLDRYPENAISYGTAIGEIIKGRFQPHHHIFTAYGNQFNNKCSLRVNDKDIISYIAGETITKDIPNGWCAIIVNGCPIGGGKAVDSVIKNHYPKGLRMR